MSLNHDHDSQIHACNDCGLEQFYCEGLGWYFHTDPKAPSCFLNQETHAEATFRSTFEEFYKAGMALVEAWDDDGFNADERFPLPPHLAPPLSLDEWLMELQEHYQTGGVR